MGLRNHFSYLFLLFSGMVLIMACSVQASDHSDFEIRIDEEAEDSCGLAETIQAMENDPSYLYKLREGEDPKYRIVAPMTALTMDFRPERQTIVLDEKNKRITMKCG